MGKKIKKGKSPHKEKRVPSKSPKLVSQQGSSTAESIEDKVLVETESKAGVELPKLCPHIKKGVNLVALSDKIGSAGHVRCEDCREIAGDRRGSKGKGKHGKKKGTDVESKSETKAIWVCLECGHYACGGVGLPSNAQCHALRHARQTRHPIAIQYDNPQLRWCFQCTTLIPVEKSEPDCDQKDMLSNAVKLIKGCSAGGAAADVEDVWFGSGSVKSNVILESSSAAGPGRRGNYMVRGLLNLGNTCFFNSVLQNLLAMDRLRNYFSNLDRSFGPLSISLKKLYAETNIDMGLRDVINPKQFFGCICAKAPQFKGYQQQDSHELLRCLLDRLSIEELGVRKQVSSSQENGVSPSQDPTFVDAVFGGQVSSTVCCLECGHSSTVYEPFLDLSLPVPTKKPFSKKDQRVSHAKKTKVPPRRVGRGHSKVKKDANPAPTRNVSKAETTSECSQQIEPNVLVAEEMITYTHESTRSDVIYPSASGEPSKQVQSKIQIDEKQVASSDDSAWLDVVSPSINLNEGSVLQNVMEGTSALLDDSAWLDYLDPGTLSEDHDLAPQGGDALSTVDGSKDIIQNESSIQYSSESNNSHFMELNPKVASSVNPWEDEVPLQVQGSVVLLLPYREETFTAEEILVEGEASSSGVCKEESLDFDGFGDLFNEPEVASGSNMDSMLSESNIQGNGAATTVFSESDPDEVDDSDSPVSVESCLSYFTKPELLSNEHGWHCEKCSLIVQRQRRMAKKDQTRTASKSGLNGFKSSISSNSLKSEKDNSCSTELRNLNNGGIGSDDVSNSSIESLTSQTGKTNVSNQDQINHVKDCTGLDSSKHQQIKGKFEIEAVPLELPSSELSRSCGQASGSCGINEPSTGGTTNNAQQNNPYVSAGDNESGGSEDEMDSQSVKVTRNATKRFLIDKTPPILTIQLKRFSQDARGRLSKLNGHVDFRETFDLTPYINPRCRKGEKYNYRLLGVVEHLGSMRGGHYVAYVRGERGGGKDVWYHASDAYVSEVSLEEVLRSEAYILFYEQI